MNSGTMINQIISREILDSRGNPTVCTKVFLVDGEQGKGLVPSGASTGAFEAVELRDNEKRYLGLGVKKAVDNVNNEIKNKVCGMDALEQKKIDECLIKLDGTGNKGKLGANAVLSVSLAVAIAAANSVKKPLYKYIGGMKKYILPVPMMNIINGGKHSDSSLSIQEFMIMPVGATSFEQCVQMSAEVFHTLKKLLKDKGYTISVGDEGGFAPNLKSDEEAIEYIVKAIEMAGYKSGEDFVIALDVAATELYEEARKNNREGEYLFWKSNEYKTAEEMIKYLKMLCDKYPIKSIEDGLSEEDWDGWVKLTKELGSTVQLVGDDLFVTNSERLKKGIQLHAANAILIKPNQIGSLTETLDAIYMAQNAGYNVIISHRSGETEDTFIADLSVAVCSGQIKTGAPCRSERTAKYNRLLEIEYEEGSGCEFINPFSL